MSTGWIAALLRASVKKAALREFDGHGTLSQRRTSARKVFVAQRSSIAINELGCRAINPPV